MRTIQINPNLILRDDGKLFNVHTGEEFMPKSRSGGYIQVRIYGRNRLVHQLVMEHFGPPKPGPEYEVDHINRNRLDNRLENLRWVTPRENANNRKTSLPIGERFCDIPLNEYHRKRQAYRYSTHKENCLSAARKYRESHREEIRCKARERYKKKERG